MIGEIRQNFPEASASVGLILATALNESILSAWFICILIEVLQKNTFGFFESKILP